MACSRVHDKDCFGEVKSFTTKDIKAKVTTYEASNIGFNKVTLRGFLSVENTISLNKTIGFWYGNGTTIEQLKSNGTKVIASLENDGSFSSQIVPLSPNSTYYYVAFAIVQNKEVFGDIKVFTTNSLPNGAVDLGLSVAWAYCNIGATSLEQFGNYYAWGETMPKTDYSWSSYKWCNGGDKITKYNDDDKKTALEPEDDAATINMGGNWRTPTIEEWKELINNCIWEESVINGVKGWKAISKKNSNSIFLPAASHYNGTSMNNWDSGYWANRIDSSFGAHCVKFDNGRYGSGLGNIFTHVHDRCKGVPVRAVID